jgi:hypothetical protein
MSDATFPAFLNELGEELFGAQWLWLRPHVALWVQQNPERVAWLRKRLQQRLREGTL